MEKLRSQQKDVLEYLKEHGSITSMQAWEMFHATRLASIIHRLRKNHIIETRECVGANDYGAYNYAMYVYGGVKEND